MMRHQPQGEEDQCIGNDDTSDGIPIHPKLLQMKRGNAIQLFHFTILSDFCNVICKNITPQERGPFLPQ